jgi:hypothetical protein
MFYSPPHPQREREETQKNKEGDKEKSKTEKNEEG